MTILISKQDTDITTNEFYRVEASQLGTFGNHAFSESLSAARQVALTFANAGNCLGVVLMFRSVFVDVVSDIRPVTVDLQELVLGVWTTRATKTLTRAQILTGTNPAGSWLVPFEFTAPYAVTTAVGVWRLNVYSAAGAQTRHFDITKTNGSTYVYAAWCDTQLTPVSGSDSIIFKNYVDITTSFTFKAVLGVAEATRGYCAWVCRNLDPTPDNVCYARVPTSIGSPVTIGIDGHFVLSTHGGFRAGTQDDPHAADMVLIQYLTPTVGSSSSLFCDTTAFGAGGSLTNRLFLLLYGVYPAKKGAIATNTCAVGGTTIDVDDPTAFVVDDFVMIGKRANYNTEESGIPRHRITGIAGNTLTFTPALAGFASHIGARVLKTYNNATNATGYGITMRRVGGTNAYNLIGGFGLPSGFVLEGVFIEHLFYSGSNNQGSVEDAAYNLGYRFKDCLILNSTASNSYGTSHSVFINGGPLPFTQMWVENCIFTRMALFTSFVIGVVSSGNPQKNYIATKMFLYNLIFMRIGANGVINGGLDNPATGGVVQVVDGIYLDSVGAGRSGMFITGTASSWKNIEVWAYGGGGFNSGAVRISSLFSSVVENIKVNNSIKGLNFEGVSTDNKIINTTFGDELANTTDILSNAKAFITATFKGINGNPTFDLTALAENADGTEIAFENVNAANVDYVRQPYGDIFRTGVGLADTTVHTAGGYALRFQPKSAISPVYWEQNLPTGDIQNKTMTLGVWIKLNNAAYWAGTHQMPRLTITFDNGADSVYAEAAQTTNWQFVQVAITPTTTFGQITCRIDGETDATSTNAYFYVDDFTAPLPQGSTLNLGGLDLWSDGLPVAPANFATTVTAADVWAADPTQFGAATVGDKVNKIKNDTGLIPALL